MKLKKHVTQEMITEYFKNKNIRTYTYGCSIHVPETVDWEYDLHINLENRTVSSFGLDEYIIEDFIKNDWVEGELR